MLQSSIPVRILVIDDDAMSRELLAVLLEGERYAVDTADSGEAALTLLHQNGKAPDVVLTDMQMPGTTGGQLAQELRTACGSSTLLLAMSGSQPAEESIAQFDAFLLKPFKVEHIADILSSHAALDPGDTSAPQSASNSTMESSLQERAQSPTSDSHAAPVLNEKIYQQLAGSMPSPQLLEMYTMCLNDARERISVMRDLLTSRDNTRFVREAHSIKGSCGMLGATQLHGMAAELEKNGLENAGDQAKQEVNSLDELSAACDRLERMLGSRV
jgi:CheY-like chemotaxis protein/HPt (histidine-containing phosphotransfer) domain-containing protein